METYGATPATSKTSGSREMTVGLTVMLVSVSAAMHFGAGGFGLLLCFGAVLVSASLVAAGVRKANGPAPIVPVVFATARALAAFMRRNTAAVWVVVASCAVTVLVSGGEAHPVLCFATFALLLLGVSLISIGARGE